VDFIINGVDKMKIYTSEQIVEMCDEWLNFNGFTGELCGQCKRQQMFLHWEVDGFVIVDTLIFKVGLMLIYHMKILIWERQTILF